MTLLAASISAEVLLPRDRDIQGIKNLCGGGSVQRQSTELDSAIRNWASSNSESSISLARENLAAVIEKITANSSGNALYTTYVGCVQNLIEHFLGARGDVSGQDQLLQLADYQDKAAADRVDATNIRRINSPICVQIKQRLISTGKHSVRLDIERNLSGIKPEELTQYKAQLTQNFEQRNQVLDMLVGQAQVNGCMN